MSDDHRTVKVMRLHCYWMVLVTIVWTIQLNVSARETTANVRRVRWFERKLSFERHEEDSKGDSGRNGNTMDDDGNNATIPFGSTAKVNMKTDVGVIEANNWQSQIHAQTPGNASIPISKDAIVTDDENTKASKNYNYSDDDASSVEFVAHGAHDPVSLTSSATLTSETNEITISSNKILTNLSKALNSANGNFDADATGSKGSVHREFTVADRASKLHEITEISAPLIANSATSRVYRRTSVFSVETHGDEGDSSLSGIRPTTEHSSDDTNRMGFSTRSNNYAGKQRSMNGVRTSPDDLSSADARRRIFLPSVTNIAFADRDYGNEREKMSMPSNARSSNGETFGILKNKGASNVIKTVEEIAVTDRTSESKRNVADDEKYDSNEFNKIEPSTESHGATKIPEKRRKRVEDPANSETFRLFVGFGKSTQRKGRRVAGSSGAERQEAEFIISHRTNDINLVPVADDIPFKEGSFKNARLLVNAAHNAKTSVLTEGADENFRHTDIPSVKASSRSPLSRRPETKVVNEQRQKVQRINYLGSKKANRRSYLASLSGNETRKINGEKVGVTGTNEENGVSRIRRSGETRNNDGSVMPDLNEGTTRISGSGGFVDNAENPDAAPGNRNHRNVVKIALKGFQTEQLSHKSLIARDSAEGIDQRRDLMQVERLQEEREQVRKRLSQMDIPMIGGSRYSKNGAPESITFKDSNAFAFVAARGRGTIVSKSIVTPEQTRRAGFAEKDRDVGRDSGSERTAGDGVISSKEKVSEASLRGDAENRDAGIVEKNLANMMEKIDWRTATPSPTESTLAELHPRDYGSDERDEVRYDCNADGVTTDIVRPKGTEEQQDGASIQRRNDDSGGEKSSDGRSKNCSKLVAALASFEHLKSVGRDNGVDGVVSTEEGRNIRNDKTNVEADARIMASNRLVSILLKDESGIHDVTSEGPFRLVDKNDRDDERIGFRGNLKISETNPVTTITGLKSRDSITIGNDSFDIPNERRNHTDVKTSDVKLCETCRIAAIAENVSDKTEENVRSVSEGRGRKNVDDDTKKMESSIMDFRETLSTIGAGRTNEIPIEREGTFGDGGSLAHSNGEFRAIDHLVPDARVGEQLQRKDASTLVRGQETIFIASERENLILSRERATERALDSERLNVTDDVVASELIIGQRDENNDDGSYVRLDAGTRANNFHSSSRMKKAYAEQTRGPFVRRIIESFTVRGNSSTEFSNNALKRPRSRENFSIYGTARGGSSFAGGRHRKSLARDEVTAGSKSSTKTDSGVRSIGRTSDDDGYSTREELSRFTKSEVSSVSSVYPESRDNAAAEQITKGFPKEDGITITVTEPTTSHYSGYTSSAVVPSPTAGDTEPTENSIATIEDDISQSVSSSTDLSVIETEKLWNEGATPSRNMTPIAVIDLSTVNFTAPSSKGKNQGFVKSSETRKSTNASVQASANLQRARNDKQHENIKNHLRTDVGSLNHTDRDNSTRVTATLNQWPVKHSAVVEGDLLLGGLMMVHEREDSITCGPVMPQGGVQALEAMLYTLDWLNKENLVPGVKIGAHILDDCDKDTYGLEMAVDFIKG